MRIPKKKLSDSNHEPKKDEVGTNHQNEVTVEASKN
jgi:hypothetical protein